MGPWEPNTLIVWNERTGLWRKCGEWNGLGTYAVLDAFGRARSLHIDLNEHPTCPVCNGYDEHKIGCPRPRPTSTSRDIGC